MPAGSTVQITITVSNPAGGDGCVNFNESAQSSTRLLLTPPNERDSLTVGAPGRGVLVCHPRVFPIGSTKHHPLGSCDHLRLLIRQVR